MSLKDTEKKLYDPNSKIEKREHSKSIFDLDNKKHFSEDNKFYSGRKKWGKRFFFDFDAKRIIYIGGAILSVLLILATVVVGIYKFKKGSFSVDRVAISISGDISTNSAENTKFIIKYKNNNRTNLKDVKIVLSHPDSFYMKKNRNWKRISDRKDVINIGTIKAYGEGILEMEGKFYTAENRTVYLSAEMRYMPENFNSSFATKSQISVNVSSSPLKLKMETPKDALDNSSIEYKIFYKNEGKISLKNLNLELNYPEGFTFQGADPKPINISEHKIIWHLGDVSEGENGHITIRGEVFGNRYDAKLFKCLVYANGNNNEKIVYSKAEGLIKIVVPPLSINHKVNDKSYLNASFGDILRYKIRYANNGDINLRNVIIKLKIDSTIIDYGNIKLNFGALDMKTKTIIWKASDIKKLKNLEPGESGEIVFDIPLKNTIEINNSADKNFIIKSVAIIDSSDIAYADLGVSKNISNEVIIKMNSKVDLSTQVFYADSLIKNQGPIPPKVGKETTYTVVWKVKNLSNNLLNTKVKAYLPTWVKWKGVVKPENENISFDERTNMVSWDIGLLPAGTGYLSNEKECRFQIGVVPEINQKEKVIDLLLESSLKANDGFTGEYIVVKNPKKTTRIIDDKEVPSDGYLVKE